MSILCNWKHPDCKNASKDRFHQIKCHALTDCYFPERKDCPFYKKNEKYTQDALDKQLYNDIKKDVEEMGGV